MICGQTSQGGRGAAENSRVSALTATARWQSARASSSVSTSIAPARTSVAPLANATASGCEQMPAKRGRTTVSERKPMTRIARAVAPTLPP